MLKCVKGCLLAVVALLAMQTIATAVEEPFEDVEIEITENYTLRFTDSISIEDEDEYAHGFIVINEVEALQIGSIIYNDYALHFEADRAEVQGFTVTVYYQAYYKNETTGEDEESSGATLWATYTCLPNMIEIQYHLTVSDEKYASGTMFECRPFDFLPEETKTYNDEELYKSGLWTRYKKEIDGEVKYGTSYEVKDAYFRNFINPYKKIMMKLEAKAGEAEWGNDLYQYIPFTGPDTTGQYTSTVRLVIYPKSLSKAGVAAAVAGDRDAAVEISTGQSHPYNRFKQGPPEFTVNVSNPRGTPIEGDLTVTARTMDNKEVLKRTPQHVSVLALDTREIPIKLPEPEVDPERELYFIEASYTPNNTNGIEYFTRTNIAILPDFTFRHKNESVFGISDYFPLPNDLSALELLQRLGVHHLRDGDNREIPAGINIHAFAHTNFELTQWPDEDERTNELTKLLELFHNRENDVWELGNELNQVCEESDDPAECGEKKKDVANEYANWAKLACDIRHDLGYHEDEDDDMKIDIVTMGISGLDEEFLGYLKENGCYELLDGLAFHPGRGNLTADAEEGDWNYYGTVKWYMDHADVAMGKRVYATEVYAGTMPNYWWKDSYRQAAANIVLSLALGLAEGLSSIQVYQLNDGTWSDVCGIYDPSTEDNGEYTAGNAMEYHFGLLMRDVSLKPSAMAYAATAEILDGAKFVTYLNDRTKTLRALVFDTDKGKVTILWDRSDGYIQGTEEDEVCHSEPWVPTYNTKIKYKFKTNKPEVTVIDMIGRKDTVTAVDGYVELELNGEPIFVYDIDQPTLNAGIFLLLLE